MIQSCILISTENARVLCEWYRDDCTQQLQIRERVKRFAADTGLVEKNYELLSLDAQLKLQ